MLARVLSCTVFGIEAFSVEVEVDIANGLPAFSIVGLPDTACRESLDRVRAAIKNSGIVFPSKKITFSGFIRAERLTPSGCLIIRTVTVLI